MAKLLISLLLLVLPGLADVSKLTQAQELYEHTRYEQALGLLNSIPDKDAAAYALMGKCEYMRGDFKKATEALEKAVNAAPENSEYYDWLGKAYGRRAESSSFFTAPGYASKARDYFQKAVDLDPHNLEAISDLFDYYLEAPGFLGGGRDKAAALADRVKSLDKAEYYYFEARLAEKQKEYDTAEERLRTAVELAPRQVGRIIDLAKFLASRGRYEESDKAFQQAEKVAPNSPKVMFARASTYIRERRNLPEARRLLEQYLKSQLTPDDPPREEAERLLKKAEKAG
jgi:tetratricopeptide (TPR) repeat protein